MLSRTYNIRSCIYNTPIVNQYLQAKYNNKKSTFDINQLRDLINEKIEENQYKDDDVD